jgi:hypothetical protein
VIKNFHKSNFEFHQVSIAHTLYSKLGSVSNLPFLKGVEIPTTTTNYRFFPFSLSAFHKSRFLVVWEKQQQHISLTFFHAAYLRFFSPIVFVSQV